MSKFTKIIKNWAEHPHISHDDVTKCGLCWREQIQSDVSKEFLQSREEVTESDFRGIMDESGKRWRETALYARVKELLHSGKSLQQIDEDLREEGIEI